MFPLESAIDFNILTLKDSRDFELSLISWETIGSIIKLHEKFRWFNNTKSLWISPEDIISQVGKQFILIKRPKKDANKLHFTQVVLGLTFHILFSVLRI